MNDPHGFLKFPRRPVPARPVQERLSDWNEVYAGQARLPLVSEQAGRCMDCGIPFCHSGCPLGNLIPEWNTYVRRENWQAAAERLHATNNFPEFTGRLCPAPCEDACVLTINADPVTIKNVEQAIADQIWERGYAAPRPPERLSGKTVAVVGSGPAGLAAAQQLTRIGHTVAVYERADRIGGLLRYGIPEFKMEKRHLDRRIEQMLAEGTKFRTGVEIGSDLDAAELVERHDAVVIAVGARGQRELPVPGRELHGIHQAMDYLTLANRVTQGDCDAPAVTAEGKHVVIIGGGDTGSDCMGTALRQGAASVVQLDINPEPGDDRSDSEPWPVHPKVYRISHAHEEARGRRGADPRVFASATLRFEGDRTGRVHELRLAEVEPETRRPLPGTERGIPADLVLLALGFYGPERDTGLMRQLGLTLDGRGNFARNAGFGAETADPPGRAARRRTGAIFIAGDAGRGQSLVVWAIAEGRSAAAATDRCLSGSTVLPAPIAPQDRPLVA
ncbi:glutamate synthase subunit beta [Streptomyces sp. NBC_00825]|uniref:glutamate synthase subunit beta n=1 Tax=unclassified Streptomyces TaxID=2593676 RepID=UPI00225B9CAD|nr:MULTISPECIES: glutamate synthase subunit beta [unclassified Streptomyces]WTB58998.1 glutamate synthase subunit beta [Streptomyces sp. NBC_00826]WTH88127.1 glutamate synthase subunit beta [Streptomyces sp. NBC_00825]WTH96854.1 glutamate synthase subunit beta [Streptomyces sp. NBC_00822]MCX4870770.1 glutamate synthase subunit beta [Streptomyces sp. NBC_00906]MCX4901510.1 glutamate synthase subunit beta [Streptomyces sp. NBC_00892]